MLFSPQLKHNVKRSLIEASLEQAHRQGIQDHAQFEKLIRRYAGVSTSRCSIKNTALDENFYRSLLPNIILMALKWHFHFKDPIARLTARTSNSITLTQTQVACIMANSFLCTLNIKPLMMYNILAETGELAEQRLKCLLNYFNRILRDAEAGSSSAVGSITFERNPVVSPIDIRISSEKLRNIKVFTATCRKRSELDPLQHRKIQVVYSGNDLGQKTFGWHYNEKTGIPILTHPELMITTLLFEALGEQEAIVVRGCEKFNSIEGCTNLKWKGDHEDVEPRDNEGRRLRTVVILNGTAQVHSFYEQFGMEAISKDVQRFRVGIQRSPLEEGKRLVTTGYWTKGIGNASKYIKFITTLIACMIEGRDLQYLTGRNAKFGNEIVRLMITLRGKDISVANLVEGVTKFEMHAKRNQRNNTRHPDRYLFDFLRSSL